MTTRRLFTTLFLLALFAMAVRATIDPDMWWHLRTGAYILQAGIPRQDVFSYTVPNHAWVTHEWLSQVVLWGVYVAGGMPALILSTAALITLTFALIYYSSPGRPYLAAFVTLLAAIASSIVWGARPQMFNLLLLALFIYLLEAYRSGRLSARALWVFLPLTALWANLHSGYLVGIVLLAAVVVGESWQRLTRGTDAFTWAQIRRLALTTLLSFLAAALNPNGPALWLYPFATLGSGAMQAHIQEWLSPDFHLPIFWAFAGMMMLGVLSLSLSRARPTWTDMLLLLGTFAAGLLSARHIPIFALVATPVICRHLLLATANTPLHAIFAGSHPAPKGAPALNWLLILLSLLVVTAWSARVIQDNDAAIADHFPVRAVDYLIAHDMDQAHGYNSYGWGGYLIWRGLPVFVDGRADVYRDDFLLYYLKTLELQPDWDAPLRQFDVDYVLMERGAPLTTLLASQPDWQEAYADAVAQIFVKVDE